MAEAPDDACFGGMVGVRAGLAATAACNCNKRGTAWGQFATKQTAVVSHKTGNVVEHELGELCQVVESGEG